MVSNNVGFETYLILFNPFILQAYETDHFIVTHISPFSHEIALDIDGDKELARPNLLKSIQHHLHSSLRSLHTTRILNMRGFYASTLIKSMIKSKTRYL